MKFLTLKKRTIFYLLGIIAVGFLLLTAFVVLDPLSSIDREFSEEIQEHHNQLVDALMNGVSWFGYMPNSPIVVLCTALVFFIAKYKREALFIVGTLLSGLVSSVAKFLVNRPRPLQSLVRVMGTSSQQSFPSGHVVFYIVFFGFLALLMYRLKGIPNLLRWLVGTVSMLLIFTVPVSRIYLGAHWFTDVLGGLLLGLLCLYTLSYFYLKKFRAG